VTTVDDALRARISGAAGEGSVAADGTVTPQTLAQLVEAVRVLSDTRTPFAMASGGATTSAPSVVLNLKRMSAILLRAPSLTLRAEAGASIAAARDAASKEKLAIVGLPDVEGSLSVGSLVAHGGVPRRSLAGIEAVLATGEVVHSGAAVLKDVVGYDLPALLLGSMGRLAVIAAVTFRLEPAAARTAALPPSGARPSVDPAIARAFDPQGLLLTPTA